MDQARDVVALAASEGRHLGDHLALFLVHMVRLALRSGNRTLRPVDDVAISSASFICMFFATFDDLIHQENHRRLHLSDRLKARIVR